MKRRCVALVLALVMVFGVFGVLGKNAMAAASASFTGFYGQDIADTHVRFLVSTNDTLALNTFLTGTFYVNGQENTSLGFMKAGDYHYAIFTDSITVVEGTTIKLGGTYTATGGSEVNFAEVTFVYRGTDWEVYVPAANATFDAFYGQDIADTHIRMTVTTDDTLAENTFLTGTFYVNGEENTSLGFMKAGSYHYAVFTDSITVTEGTEIKMGGTYTATDGRKVNFAEVTFVYKGTDWEVYVPTANAAFASFYGQDIPDKHIRMVVTTNDTFAVNTVLTGTFTVDGNTNTTLGFMKAGESHYAVFTDSINVEEGTKIKLGGMYTTADGKKVIFAEVTFVYQGTDWAIEYPTANAAYSSLYGQDITDTHIRMVVTTDDTFADNTFLSGAFYVDGELNTSLGFMKAGSVNYAIFTDSITVKEGTKIKIGGIYATPDGRQINFAEVTFIYNGSHWEVYYPTANASFNSLYGLDIADKHIRMTVTTEDTFALNTVLTGQFEVDGQANTSLGFMKVGDYHYALFTDSIQVVEGTKIKFGGIYTAADGRKVNFAEVTFIYNGTNWEVDYPTADAAFSALYGQDIPDTHIRMVVTTNDTIPENTFLTGKFYVNGQENTSLTLMKAGEFHYALFTDSIDVVEGTKIKLGGVYKAADGRKVKFAEATFRYNGATWESVYEGEPSKAKDINVIHHHLTDTFIRFSVTSDDTIVAYEQIAGKIYVDGKLRTDVSLMKDAEGFYVILIADAPAGTLVKIEGVYMSASGAVEFPLAEFKYNGTDWGMLYAGKASRAKDLTVIHHHLTDTFIRFNVTSDDTIGAHESMFGDLYVDGKLRQDVQMFKDPEGFFAILLPEAAIGTSVKIGGKYMSQSGAIELPSTEFKYNGADWVIVYTGKVEKAENLLLVNQSVTDFHIRFRVDSADTIGVYEVILGDIYVDGKLSANASMMKSAEGGFYAIFMDEAKVGTTVKIGGVYMSASGAVEMPVTEFIYDGQSWGIVFKGTPPKVDVVQIVDHNMTDTYIRMNVNGESIVGVNAKISGDIYVNGQLSSDVTLAKYTEGYYVVYMEEAVAGTVVTIGGKYKTYATAVEFPSIDFKYDGANWGIVRYEDVNLSDLHYDELDDGLVRYEGTQSEKKSVNTTGNNIIWKIVILVCSVCIIGVLTVTGVVTWKRKSKMRLE